MRCIGRSQLSGMKLSACSAMCGCARESSESKLSTYQIFGSVILSLGNTGYDKNTFVIKYTNKSSSSLNFHSSFGQSTFII